MMKLNASIIEKLIKQWVPMAEMMNVSIEQAGDSRSRVRIPYDENWVRPGGTVSGPVMMTAGDLAMYAAILGTLGEVQMAVTSNLNINFLQRPAPKALIAEGEILKLGKRIAFCEVSIYSEGSDELVAHVTGSYALPPEMS